MLDKHNENTPVLYPQLTLTGLNVGEFAAAQPGLVFLAAHVLHTLPPPLQALCYLCLIKACYQTAYFP